MKSNILKIDNKGRVCLPKWMREKKGLKVGSMVRIGTEKRAIVLEEVKHD